MVTVHLDIYQTLWRIELVVLNSEHKAVWGLRVNTRDPSLIFLVNRCFWFAISSRDCSDQDHKNRRFTVGFTDSAPPLWKEISAKPRKSVGSLSSTSHWSLRSVQQNLVYIKNYNCIILVFERTVQRSDSHHKETSTTNHHQQAYTKIGAGLISRTYSTHVP